MINIFKHLLPTGRAWSITADKNLRKFFDSLVSTVQDPRDFADKIFLDIFPLTTRFLSEWETQFGLSNVRLSDSARRSRLDAAWKNSGGQSPGYIQQLLQDNGFDVYVHDWWVPGTEPPIGTVGAADPRNPFLVLNPEYSVTLPGVDCGEALAACGESFAECGNGPVGLVGYPLVNKFIYDSDEIGYTIPVDSTKWPFFMYVGGLNYGEIAEIPAIRRFEFEELLLRTRPSQLWIGVIVRYV